MPTAITDVSEFTATVEGPADADPQAADSYLPGYQGLANRTRFLRDYCTDDGIQLPATRQHLRYIGPQSARPKDSEWQARGQASSPDDFDGVWRSNGNFGELYLDLTPRLVRGGTLIRARVLIRPGAARGSGNRMQFFVVGVSFGASFASPSITPTLIGSAVEDDGTTALQWRTVDLSPSGEAVAPYVAWYLKVIAGSDGASNRDYFYGAVVEVASQTIRND